MFCTIFFAANCKAHTGLEQIEKKHNVKIGVHAIDPNNGNTFSHRQDERFSFQSTMKLIVSSAILKKIDTDDETA